ncbi:MAG: TMEM175 family protein [Planctomycetota bacterium]
MIRRALMPAGGNGSGHQDAAELIAADGFRLRGQQMTRLETFVDAAFAFAVTMLALSQDSVPQSYDQLIELFKGIPAFLGSLAILSLFWTGHVRFCRRYGLEDTGTTVISLALVGVMLIYVYPLKMMMTSGFGTFIPPLRTASYAASFSSPQQVGMAFVMMSSGYALLMVIYCVMYLNALRHKSAIGLSAREIALTRATAGSFVVYVLVGVASIVLALTLNRGWWVTSAGAVYASLGVLVPLYWVFASRNIPAAAARSGTTGAPVV